MVQTDSLQRGKRPLRGCKESVIAESLCRTAGRGVGGGALPGILFKLVNCSQGIGMDINECMLLGFAALKTRWHVAAFDMGTLVRQESILI